MTRRADIPSTERGLTHIVTRGGKLERRYIPASFPSGILVGSAGFDAAYAAPGSLLYLYRMGDTFAFPSSGTDVTDALRDTANYDSTHRNLTYHEQSAAVGWTTANRPSQHQLEHPVFGDADDGCMRWLADGAVGGGGSFPGAAFSVITDSVFDLTKTWTAWFNPDPAASSVAGGGIPRNALVCGTWEGNGSGATHGSGIFYDYVNDRFFFENADAPFDILGPGGLARGEWYLVAVTFDAGTYTLWVNAVAVGTHSGGAALFSGGTKFRVGGTRESAGPTDMGYYVCGAVDDVAGWATALTSAELADINGLTGTVSTVTTVTVGSTEDVGPIAGVHTGTALEHQVLEADGSGGSRLRYPTIDFLVDGV